MGRRAVAVSFDGTPPPVKTGDRVEVRDADGRWHTGMVALGPARYDFGNALGGFCYLTVPVCGAAGWEARGAGARSTNWPAEAVRLPDGGGGQP